MNHPTRIAPILLLLVVLASGCTRADQASTEQRAPDQAELFSFAFDVAKAFPLEPHRRNRSRAQEHVAMQCVQAGRLAQAESFAEEILDWRRGAVYGALAVRYAELSEPRQVERLEKLATPIAEKHRGFEREKILVSFAQAHAILGRKDAADQADQALTEESQKGRIIGYQQPSSEDQPAQLISQTLGMLQAQVRQRSFDQVRNLAESAVRLYERFYEEQALREQLAVGIEQGMQLGKLPYFARVELYHDMARAAAKHGDQETAAKFLRTVEQILESPKWNDQIRLPLEARLAVTWKQAGFEKQARVVLEKAMAVFAEKRDEIRNFEQAEILVSLAEAYADLGDRSKAYDIYAQALEQGAVNPNIRPRIDDLSATASSMALHEIMPDQKLWRRMQEIYKSLGSGK